MATPDVRSPVPPTSLWASLTFVFLASAGTGVATAGVYFVAERAFGFGALRNFAMAALFGAVYVPGALAIGPALRRACLRWSWLSPRGALGGLMAVQGAFCLLPALFASEEAHTGQWTLWVIAAVNGGLAGAQWPIAESYVTGGRRGQELRTATGRFNIVWSVSLVFTLWAIAPLVKNRPLDVLTVLAGAYALCALTVLWLKPEPARHLPDPHGPVPPDYRPLLQIFRFQLPVSFMVIAVIEPFLPSILTAIGVQAAWKTPAAATWMLTRVGAFILLERWHGWHGRWWMTVGPAGAMLIGFGLSAAAPLLAPPAGLPTLLAGLALFGLAVGAIYHAAFHYAMEVGEAAVDAAGVHEALIGAGYTVGPACGLVLWGLAGAGVIHTERLEVLLVAVICGLATALLTIAGVVGLRGRRARRAPTES
ncbi:MAG: hypothetical protein ACF8R7_06805 [Phycisphaerales bacterium JB039]